ncbi:MAG: hypothetical protein PHP45_05215, partial [Elusimicrobiales bacterium]|nr:hypothetical protein [Elusimicrobiales bacterium]
MQNRRTSKLLLLTTLLALPFFAVAGDANWTGGIALPGGTELKPVPPAPQPHENEIMIDATEAGVGGFHRVDNKIHPYGADNVWRGHIVPPQITDNIFDAGNGFIGVRFESLEELFKTLAALANKRQAKIAVLNINSHGIPGCLFVPKSGSGDMTDDMESYNTYYTPVGKSDIMQLRAMAQSTSQQHWSGASCEPEFRAVIAAIPDMKSYFTADAQIHIQACVVGLDARGKRFTETLAELLLDGDKAA